MARKSEHRLGLLALVLLAGCATRPPADAPPPVAPAPAVEERAPAGPPAVRQAPAQAAEPTESPAPALPVLSPAARSLADKADRASREGKHEEAAAYLERALRIAPKHPVLWQNLAVVRYRQQDYAKVEGLAMKSNTLAPNVPSLQRVNWELIAAVRRLGGDKRGAEAAAAQARRLQ